MMKNTPISIGFDDAKFDLKSKLTTTNLIGVVCQGTRLVRVVKKEIKIDGDNATNILIKLVKLNEKHVQYILTDSITFGGFNIIDLKKIYSAVKKPIIAVTERLVDLSLVHQALKKKFPKTYSQKLQKIVNAGNLYDIEVETAGGTSKIYCHFKGISILDTKELLQKICIDSKLPEPVRLAHLIGKAF